MGDAERVDVMLGELRRAWLCQPGLRLAQVLSNAHVLAPPRYGVGALRDVEDADLLNGIQAVARALDPDGHQMAAYDANQAAQGATAGVDTDTAEQAAQWLAQACGSPRFGGDGLGWMALLDGEHNVEFAARRATAAGAPPENVAAARAVLVRWYQERPEGRDTTAAAPDG